MTPLEHSNYIQKLDLKSQAGLYYPICILDTYASRQGSNHKQHRLGAMEAAEHLLPKWPPARKDCVGSIYAWIGQVGLLREVNPISEPTVDQVPRVRSNRKRHKDDHSDGDISRIIKAIDKRPEK